MSVKVGEYSVDFDTDCELRPLVMHRPPNSPGYVDGPFGVAEGGYILVRLDIDGEDCTVVHVDPASPWCPTDGKSPADMIGRAAGYLPALRDRLRTIDAVAEARS